MRAGPDSPPPTAPAAATGAAAGSSIADNAAGSSHHAAYATRAPNARRSGCRYASTRQIAARRDGRRYLYTPVLERDAWLSGESEGLLQRLFDGRVAPLVAHFSRQRKLSRKDIAELRKLIGELDDGKP
jgi:hypothetical protein